MTKSLESTLWTETENYINDICNFKQISEEQATTLQT